MKIQPPSLFNAIAALVATAALVLLYAASAAAMDLPPDLVGVSSNELGARVFLTTYQDTKPEVKKGAHCTGTWHLVISMRPQNPEGNLFGCYTFTAPTEITVIWANDVTSTYSSSVVYFVDWFIKLYPAHAPHQYPTPQALPKPGDTTT